MTSQYGNFSNTSIVVSGHPDDSYNGKYIAVSFLNDRPAYKNSEDRHLYYYSGSNESSYSLDDREPDGKQDWFHGGWTSSLPGGNVPLGDRVWSLSGEAFEETIRLTLSQEDVLASATVTVSGHAEPQWNGPYVQQAGFCNQGPVYVKNDGMVLYCYSGGEGVPSMSLDDRQQSGDYDWFNGGWLSLEGLEQSECSLVNMFGTHIWSLSATEGERTIQLTLTYEVSEDSEESNEDPANTRLEQAKRLIKKSMDLASTYDGIEGKIYIYKYFATLLVQLLPKELWLSLEKVIVKKYKDPYPTYYALYLEFNEILKCDAMNTNDENDDCHFEVGKFVFEGRNTRLIQGNVSMISGCMDKQTSCSTKLTTDTFKPMQPGEFSGAITTTILETLSSINEGTTSKLSKLEFMTNIREFIKNVDLQQLPQYSSSMIEDMNEPFEFVPSTCTGVKRAVIIAIHYAGTSAELPGCHHDAMNMKKYLIDNHAFLEENITMLMDDGKEMAPSKWNIVSSLNDLVASSVAGDYCFLHYSGHGDYVEDTDGDEMDGYDECIIPSTGGRILDDELHENVVLRLKKDVTMLAVFDSCMSGTMLDLPYHFKFDDDCCGDIEDKRA